MSFIRTSIEGEQLSAETPRPPEPVVVNAGFPGFRASIPLTTPDRQQIALYAVLGIGFFGFLTVAAAVAYATKTKNK
jgi:hypothetical protein